MKGNLTLARKRTQKKWGGVLLFCQLLNSCCISLRVFLYRKNAEDRIPPRGCQPNRKTSPRDVDIKPSHLKNFPKISMSWVPKAQVD